MIIPLTEGKLTERYNTNSLEHAVVDDQGALYGTLHLGWNSGALRDDSDYDDEHTKESERTGFRKLDAYKQE
jgi:hypothetical protein